MMTSSTIRINDITKADLDCLIKAYDLKTYDDIVTLLVQVWNRWNNDKAQIKGSFEEDKNG